MSKKILTILLAMVMAVASLTLIGCGGGDGGDPAKTVTVVYETDKRTYWEGIKAEYEALYAAQGYTLSLVPVGGGQVESKQTNMIAQGDAPDLIVGGDTHINYQYKYLLPLDDLITRDNATIDSADFIPEIMNLLKKDGQTFYLPEIFNVSLLYYNVDIFDAYNANPSNSNDQITYPTNDWTYSDFYNVAEKLTIKNGNAVSQFGCYTTIGWWGEWLVHVRQCGGDFMQNGQVILNTAAAKAGIQRYYDKMYGAGRTHTISNQIADDAAGDFSTGKFAMNYGGHINAWSEYRSVSDLTWDVAFLPMTTAGNDASRRGGEFSVGGIGIYKDSPAVEPTWELIKYITRKKTLEEYNNSAYLPCRTSGKNMLTAVPKADRPCPKNIEAVYDSMSNGYCMPLPSERYFAYVNTQIVQGYITKIVEGDPIESGLAEATSRANNYIQTNYGV